MPAVNPQILIWARETAGLSLEEAAKAINLADTKNQTAAEKLAALERGEVEPSRSILQKMSERYRRSLVVFYLDAPPRRGDRGKDFRTIPGNQLTGEDPLLDALIRDLKTRHSLVKSLLEDEDAQPLPFIGSTKMEDGVRTLVESIISTIQFEIARFRNVARIENAFSYLREQMERVGVFVILAGDLGSHHTAIAVDVFRGFAIADPIAPFIAVNSQDSKSAQCFTILHEAAHLWLGNTGVSGAYAESRIEQFCNDVAGEILLPLNELNELQHIRTLSVTEAATAIKEFAVARKISRSMVAYKLYRAQSINENQWLDLNRHFNEEWQIAKQKDKDKSTKGGPNYYTTQSYRIGQPLINLVNRAVHDGNLTPTKAGKVLGVKPRSVAPLLEAALPRRNR